MTTSGFVDVEVSRLNYEVSGSGPSVLLLHNAGHIVNIEQPEAYTEIVLDWLRSH